MSYTSISYDLKFKFVLLIFLWILENDAQFKDHMIPICLAQFGRNVLSNGKADSSFLCLVLLAFDCPLVVL